MQLIATRDYDDFDPVTRETFDLADRMFRLGDGSFVLMVAGERPQDPPEPQAYTLQRVYQWLRELPDQINLEVVTGGRK